MVFWFGFGLDFGQNNRLGSELGKTWILSLSMSVVKYSSIRFNQSAIVISTWVTHYSLFIKRTILAQKKNGSLKITFSQPKVVHSKTIFLISRSPLTVTVKISTFWNVHNLERSTFSKYPIFRKSKCPLENIQFSTIHSSEFPFFGCINLWWRKIKKFSNFILNFFSKKILNKFLITSVRRCPIVSQLSNRLFVSGRTFHCFVWKVANCEREKCVGGPTRNFVAGWLRDWLQWRFFQSVSPLTTLDRKKITRREKLF